MEVQETRVQTDRVLTIPNILSMARLVGVPIFLWLILRPEFGGPKSDGWALLILALSGISDYLDGKRASQVQPFRMFLVILLIAFFVGHAASKTGGGHEAEGDHGAPAASSPGATAKLDGQVVRPSTAAFEEFRQEVLNDPEMTEAEKRTTIAAAEGDWAAFGRNLATNVEQKARANAAAAPKMEEGPDAGRGALRSRASRLL